MRKLGQQGNALLTAMMMMTGVVGLFFVVESLKSTTESRSRVTRIKASMGTIEAKVRAIVSQPASFTGCNSSSGSSSCALSPNALSGLATTFIPGAKCPPGQSMCGIAMTADFNSSSRRVSVQMSYTGLETKIAPVKLDIEIPEEVLQSQKFACGTSTPIFLGYNADGSPKCRGFTSCGGVGQYVKAIDPATLQPICGMLDSNIGCGSGKFITAMSWGTNGFSTPTCSDQLDPFLIFDGPGTPSPTPSTSPSPAGSCPAGPGGICCWDQNSWDDGCVYGG